MIVGKTNGFLSVYPCRPLPEFSLEEAGLAI